MIASIFNIFHLLPDAAKQFKERVIDNVLDLEEKLRRTHHSPFRLPLYKYLNKYPSDVWAFTLGKLEELRYGRFLSQVLRHPHSQVLRDWGAANVEFIIKTCNNIISQGKETKFHAIINTINMLDALCQFPNTLSWLDNREHIEWLKQVGKELERNLKNNTLAPSLRLRTADGHPNQGAGEESQRLGASPWPHRLHYRG